MARECITLANGLRVCLEPIDHLRTASFGVWVAAGSGHETAENNGISHFLEHMFFKGSQTRSSQQIAAGMDAIGGQMNAFTTKEYTCFFARTLSEHVAEGFEILADMLRSPALRAEDFDLERSVILEEINMSTDDPEDLVGEQLERAVWGASPYGRPILGTQKSVLALTPEQLRAYLNQRYSARSTVISICGKYNREAFLEQVQARFGDLPAGEPMSDAEPILYRQSVKLTERPLEQTHLCFCLPALPMQSPRRYALSILNTVLGSSSSSRLFQRIREGLGLAYSIGSDVSPYRGGGLLFIQAAVGPSQAQRACEEILSTLRELQKGITAQEFSRAREGLKSSLLMSMESSMNRASYAGRGTLFGNLLGDDELLERVQAVTLEEVNALADVLLDCARLSVSVCGSIGNADFYRTLART